MCRSRSHFDPDRSIWTSVEDLGDQGDDFFCFRATPDELLPIERRPRRRSIFVLPPAAREDSESDPELDQRDYSLFIQTSKPSNFESASQTLLDLMLQYRRDLDDQLAKSSQLMERTSAFTDEFLALPPAQRDYNRLNAVSFLLAQNALLKVYHYQVGVAQMNIREIAAFQDFLDGKTSVWVDNDRFRRHCLRTGADHADRLLARANRMQQAVHPIVFRVSATREVAFLSTTQKSGRIVSRFRQFLDDMGASDVDIILQALAPNAQDVPFVRRILFDIGWEEFMFPFVDIRQMTLPDIADLTPRLFGPQFLDDQVLSTPFDRLNATEWPFKAQSLELFSFLIETDPFVIANMFWVWSDDVARIGNGLAAAAGVTGDDADLGFDVMFQYYLVAIFAFGIAEVLEVFAFAGAFLDYESDSKRQFAMTNCQAIVTYVEGLDAAQLRRKYQELVTDRPRQ
jgi:hypothetical protein